MLIGLFGAGSGSKPDGCARSPSQDPCGRRFLDNPDGPKAPRQSAGENLGHFQFEQTKRKPRKYAEVEKVPGTWKTPAVQRYFVELPGF